MTAFKFGSMPPRALESFGVSGLLSDDCRVYYDSLFSPRQVGRVSDLIAAQLRSCGVDELRMRAIVLFGFFDAYRCHANAVGAAGNLGGSKALPEPLVVEFGIDAEKVAIGISFKIGIGTDIGGLAERIFQRKPNGSFEQLLVQVHRFSDRLVVRSQLDRLELVSLIAVPGKIPSEEAKRAEAPTVVVMDAAAEIAEAPKAARYVQMGDTDYSSLLRADEGAPAGTSNGEYLAAGCTELEEAIRLRAQGATKSSPDVFIVKGRRADLVDNTKVVVQGGNEGTADTTEIRVVDSGGDEEGGAPTKAIAGILKKVWPFSKKGSAEADTGLLAEDPSADALAESGQKESAGDQVLENFMVEMQQGSLESTLSRAQSEVDEIKKDISTNRAKRWVEGLMGDLVTEKARLHEMAKKLNTSARQKVMEHRSREATLHEELRRRDEMVRQKNHALNRTKEQLQQVTLTLEKIKGSSAGREDDGQIKQKYALTQKLLSATKDENGKLHMKIDDLKGQLASAQMSVKSRASGPSNTEFSALKVKHERSTRQADELRRMNEQLSARIQTLAEKLDKKAPEKESSETLKRMELAMKQLALSQRENDQLRLRVDELQREETRLKTELKRSLVELKSAKAGGGSGGSSVPPKAA